MPIDLRHRTLAFGCLLALAGCTGTDGGLASTGAPFGEAPRQTFAAQVVNPAPTYAEPMASSGNQAAMAIERVNTDKVKKPDRTATSALATGGGAK